MIDNNKIIETLEKKLMTFGGDVKTQNVGTVIKNTDGVVVATGLSRAIMGEKVIFENGNKGSLDPVVGKDPEGNRHVVGPDFSSTEG